MYNTKSDHRGLVIRVSKEATMGVVSPMLALPLDLPEGFRVRGVVCVLTCIVNSVSSSSCFAVACGRREPSSSSGS